LRVLIVGGGIGGLTAALCLARTGHQVQVFEQAADFGDIGAGIQLSPNCTRVLHHLGLEAALRACVFVPQATQIRSWRAGAVISETALGDAAVEQYDYPYYHIHRGDLLRVLVEAAQHQPDIALNTGARVSEFCQTSTHVQLCADGSEYLGDVLIGADGIHSTIRAGLWGEQAPAFTGNVAWRALVPAARLPAGRIRPMSTVWWGPRKHFVHYYVRGGELINCVCVVEKQGWQVESWTEQGDHQELKSDFAGWHADVQLLIDQAQRDSLFKWALYDRPPMSAWGKGLVSLLGDACHPTLPFMAQGAAMAIEDSAVLAACLDTSAEVAANLQRYENLRRERTARIQKGSRRNAKIFHLSGVQAWLRNRAAKVAGNNTMNTLYRYDALRAAND